jgi:hypothetical protein
VYDTRPWRSLPIWQEMQINVTSSASIMRAPADGITIQCEHMARGHKLHKKSRSSPTEPSRQTIQYWSRRHALVQKSMRKSAYLIVLQWLTNSDLLCCWYCGWDRQLQSDTRRSAASRLFAGLFGLHHSTRSRLERHH